MNLASTCATFALVLSLTALPCRAADAVSGELVVTNAAQRQFRIVDQPGYFRAPAGVSLEALDGKPVIVELSRERKVLSITENPIPIDRVESSYETTTGKLVVVDAARGTFAIAGAPETYVAPQHVDVRRYAGQRVDLLTTARGQVLQLDLADHPGGATAVDHCSYAGRGYADGTSLCQTGTEYRCEDGIWRSLGVACGERAQSCVLDGTAYSNGAARCENGVRFLCNDGRWQYDAQGCGDQVTAASRSTESCSLGGATLAHDSQICRDGLTLRCAGGTWVNLGTACR